MNFGGTVDDLTETPQKRSNIAIIVVVVLFAGLIGYTLINQEEIIGQATEGIVVQSCPTHGKLFLSSLEDPQPLIAKCVNGKKKECVGRDCAAVRCGDGVIEGNEKCEGSDLNQQTCELQVPDTTGTLACANCQFDASACIRQPVCGDGKAEGTEECDKTDIKGALCRQDTAGTPTCTESCLLSYSSCQAITQRQSPFDLTSAGIRGISLPSYGGDWFYFNVVFQDKHTERGYTDSISTILGGTEARIAVSKNGALLREYKQKGEVSKDKGGFQGQEGKYWFQPGFRFVDFLAENGPGEYCVDRASIYHLDFKVNEAVFQTKECITIGQADATTKAPLPTYDATKPRVFMYENKLAGVCLIWEPHEYDYRQDKVSDCPEFQVTTQLDVSNVKTNYNLYTADGKKYSRFFWDLDLKIPDITMIRLSYSKDGSPVTTEVDGMEIIPFTTTKSTQLTNPKMSFHESFHGATPRPLQSSLEAGKYCIDQITVYTKSDCRKWNLRKCITIAEVQGALPFQQRFYRPEMRDEQAAVSVACPPVEIPPCVDSDNGRDKSIKGTVSYITDSASSTVRQKQLEQDYCSDNSYRVSTCDGSSGSCRVREWYCGEPKSDNPSGKAYTEANTETLCPYGCADGACLKEQVKEANVYFSLVQPYSASTTTIVGGQAITVDSIQEPTPVRTGDIMLIAAIAKNKGEGYGSFTYGYKVYYEGVLVADSVAKNKGELINYASDDPGTNYFIENNLVSTPFFVPKDPILYPEKDTRQVTKQHVVQLSGVYKKAGKYKIEFIAKSQPVGDPLTDREITYIHDNVAAKEFTVVSSRPPAFFYSAAARLTDGTRKSFVINGVAIDGAEGKECKSYEVAPDESGKSIASLACKITFTLASAGMTAQDSVERFTFSLNSYHQTSSLNAKTATITLSGAQLEPASCTNTGQQIFVCALEPTTLDSTKEYTLEFRTS